MHIDIETMDELGYAQTHWDLVGTSLRPFTDAERAASREKAKRHYHSRKHDPAFRAKNAAKTIARYHAKKAAEGKTSKRGHDKKLTASMRMEIATSSERGVDLARRFGVSPASITWIRKRWDARRAA